MTQCASVIRAPQSFVDELKREINKFIDIKRHRICGKILIGNVQNGGIGLPDVETFLISLKAAWIPRFLDINNPNPCMNIANFWFNKLGFNLRTISTKKSTRILSGHNSFL